MGLTRALAAIAVAGLIAPQAAQPAIAREASAASSAATALARLQAVIERHTEARLALDPLGFVSLGAQSDVSGFADAFSDTRWLDRAKLTRESRLALARVARDDLTPEARLRYDIFAYDLAREIDWQRSEIAPLARVLPLDHFDGLQLFYPSVVSGDGALRYRIEADYDAMLERHRALPAVFDRAIARYREGKAKGLVMGAPAVTAMVEQIDDLLALPPMRSPFAGPLRQFPAGFDDTTRNRISRAYERVIVRDVLPAYAKLRSFLAGEYLEGAPEGSGLAASPSGKQLYRTLVHRHTTLALDPDVVHTTGVSEVRRIGAELLETGRQLGLTGSLPDMFSASRSDPRFVPETPQALEDRLLATARQVQSELPRFFRYAPGDAPAIVRYPMWVERTAPGGGYAPKTETGPATVFFNAYRIETRSLAAAASLYLHEGVPGHHLEASLSSHLLDPATANQRGRYSAFTEGWALYAETLGYEMGIYDDPVARWGTLEEEMLRAIRLVVDTGLHAKGWSRARAVAYMTAHSPMSEAEATREVDRYIAAPGQALSYKIGAMTVQQLRAEAEAALADRFDLRDFHSAVLGAGPLPLPILQARVRRWIAEVSAQ